MHVQILFITAQNQNLLRANTISVNSTIDIEKSVMLVKHM